MYVRVSIAVEGITDEAVAVRLCETAGLEVGVRYPCRGSSNIDKRIDGFNKAAVYAPWLVLRDLDRAECAPELRHQLLPAPSPGMAFRVPVRAVEAWLLADRIGISSYLSVSPTLVPDDPESLANPKLALVSLARRSNKRAVKADMVPEPGISSVVGSGYPARIIDFARNHWNIEAAAAVSDSLGRALRHLRRLV